MSAADDFLGRPAGANFALVNVKILSSSHPTLGEGVGVGMRHEDTELKAKIDAALCELIKDGSLAKASEKWFEANILASCK
ncbi:transporter substrate-binding domain-containing protein [Pseudaminobacter salicylatoxidans]|uniref:transporter substrate-binding domain-containing protein n=1 Tax=Pseudaminobacter salicylatoxidans TaxID=93369 RepID=UPI001FCB3FB1|nr:transporter substrate-binding domain-containing protein [Pseudaminobacter salicylatoxidans]